MNERISIAELRKFIAAVESKPELTPLTIVAALADIAEAAADLWQALDESPALPLSVTLPLRDALARFDFDSAT